MMHRVGSREVRHAQCLFIITFLIYLGSSAGVLEFGDDWSMLQVTNSIVNHGAVNIPASTPGTALGPDGLYYSKYGLGQSILAIPFYVIGVKLSYLPESQQANSSWRRGAARKRPYFRGWCAASR